MTSERAGATIKVVLEPAGEGIITAHHSGSEEHVQQSELEARLIALIEQLRSCLPPHDGDDLRSLVEAGEPGVALENLCTQLREYDAAVGSSQYEEIQCLGTWMGLNSTYWSSLTSTQAGNR